MEDLERFKKFVRENNPMVPDLLQEFEPVRKIDSVKDIGDCDWINLMDEYDAANITWKAQMMAQEVEDALGSDEYTCHIQEYTKTGHVGVIIDGTQEFLGKKSECENYLQGFLRALEIKNENQ